MTVELRRKYDQKLMAARPSADWEGWYAEYTQPRLRTIQGVSLPQKISVMETLTMTKWRFDSKHPTMHLDQMWELVRAAHNLSIFEYTDLEGETNEVQILNVPKPTRDTRIPHYSLYTLELELLNLKYVI